MTSNPNNYPADLVYDVNMDNVEVKDLVEILSSKYPGQLLATLHQNEINYARSYQVISGIMPIEKGRDVEWFFMSKPNVDNINCEQDVHCLSSTENQDNHVSFKGQSLINGKIYYICAYINSTLVEMETGKEILPEVRACSDGVKIDDIPLLGGEVSIASVNGYTIHSTELFVSWIDFHDQRKEGDNGHPRIISHYNISIGEFDIAGTIVLLLIFLREKKEDI